MDNLKAVCRDLTQRCNNARFETFECFLCGNRTTGAESLHAHFLEFHQIKLESFHDCTNYERLLSHLRQLTVPNNQEDARQCPVCQYLSPSIKDLSSHATSAEHDQWTVQHIPSLRPFLISYEEGEEANQDAASSDDNDSDRQSENSEDDEEAEPQIPCLYCSKEISEASFDSHLLSEHGLSLQKYVSEHASVITNEYDLIRMINAVRDAQKSLVCPQDAQRSFSSAEEWATHVQSSGRYFPLTVPEGSQFLIPRIVADPLISYVLDGLEFCEELPEEDFPMVDTLQQAIVKKQQEYAAARTQEADE